MPPKRADKLRLKEEKAEKARIAQAKYHAREQQAAATARVLLLLEQEAVEREAAAVKARETTRQEIKDLVAHFSQIPSKKGRIRQVAPALCGKSVRAELQAAENSSGERETGMLDAEYAQVAAQCLKRTMEAALYIDASQVPTKLNEPPDDNGIDAFHLYAASGLGHISLDPAAEYDAIRDEHMRRRIADREIERCEETTVPFRLVHFYQSSAIISFSENEQERMQKFKQVAVDAEHVRQSAHNQMVLLASSSIVGILIYLTVFFWRTIRKDGRKGSLTYEAFGLLTNRDPVGSEKVKGNDNLRLHVKAPPEKNNCRSFWPSVLFARTSVYAFLDLCAGAALNMDSLACFDVGGVGAGLGDDPGQSAALRSPFCDFDCFAKPGVLCFA
ncbi:hypothetical protein HDU89_006050 [Geranomyces variabilis]|nr:hypothetical protein HDU89_006050 [Geranomyces variabilis]